VAFPGQYAPAPADARFPAAPSGCARLEAGERLACLESITADFGSLKRYAAVNALLGRPQPGKTRVVFFGDSIIEGWMHDAPAFFPGKAYVNRGIAGQTTAQMLLRFRADVIALEPAVVVILAGTNDVAGYAGPVTVDEIQGNLATMAELAKIHGVRVVLSSVLPVSDESRVPAGTRLLRSRKRPPATLRAINDGLAAWAARNGCVFLDYHAAMADARGMLRPELTKDGVHPNAAGYAAMAPLAEKAIAQALAGGGAPAPPQGPGRYERLASVPHVRDRRVAQNAALAAELYGESFE
jgi:lysophospholipase L1-like esterase